MVYLIPPVRSGEPIHLTGPDDSNQWVPGDQILAWDYCRFEWDATCVPARELAQWAKLGDPPVDAFLRSLPPAELAHKDLLELLLEQTLREYAQGTAEQKQKGVARTCWEEVTSEAPAGVKATAEEVERGQRVFWENVGGIFAGLAHFSLAGGFASPTITASLHKASYLIPPTSADAKYLPVTQASSERTLERLFETGAFLSDVMGCGPIPVPSSAPAHEKAAAAALLTSGLPSLLPPTPSSPPSLAGSGEGWKSAIRVRLLHGVVRRRIQLKDARAGTGGVDADGDDAVPLNVEEMVGTLSSFAVAPMWCLEKMGISLKGRGREEYLRTWRHIGFLLGIPPSILIPHFTDYTPASKFLACIVCHLFPAPPPRGSPSSITLGEQQGVLPPPTMAVLEAISNQPPFRTGIDYHLNMTRLLVGDRLADYLGVPKTTWEGAIRLRISIFFLTYPTHFANAYPSARWRNKRISLVREGMGRMLRMGLSRRRTQFRARNEVGGGLSEEAKEEERVRMDPEGGMRMVKRYRELIIEMGLVSAGALIGASVLGYSIFSRIIVPLFG